MVGDDAGGVPSRLMSRRLRESLVNRAISRRGIPTCPSHMGVSRGCRIKDSPTYHLDPVGVAGEGFAGLTPLLHFRAGPHRNRAGLFYLRGRMQK